MAGKSTGSEKTRDRILKTAKRMFGEHGFVETNLLDVAKKANITTGAIYYHFGDKRGLFKAVAVQVGQDIKNELLILNGEIKPDFDFAESAILSAIEVCADHSIQQIITRDAPMLFTHEEWREIELQGSYGDMKRLFSVILDKNLIKVVDPDIFAALCLCLVLEAASEVEQSTSKKKALKQSQSIIRDMLQPFRI